MNSTAAWASICDVGGGPGHQGPTRMSRPRPRTKMREGFLTFSAAGTGAGRPVIVCPHSGRPNRLSDQLSPANSGEGSFLNRTFSSPYVAAGSGARSFGGDLGDCCRRSLIVVNPRP